MINLIEITEINELHTFGHHHSWSHQKQLIDLRHNKRTKQYAEIQKSCSL